MSTANKRVIKGTSISYPLGRKSKFNPDGSKAPPKYANNELLQRFKHMTTPDEKRQAIAEYCPLHFSFGDVRPVWKTYQTYAQNMGLLEDD